MPVSNHVERLDPALLPPRWAIRVPGWAWLVALAAGTWVLREAAYLFTDRPGGLAVIWPAAGLTLYALLVARRRHWPVVLSIVFALGTVRGLRFGRTLTEAVAFNAADAVGVLVAAWLVVRIGGRPTLRTLRGALMLMFAPALAIGVVSAVSHLLLAAGQGSVAERRFWAFWAGESLGIVLVTSLLVEWTERGAAPRGMRAAATLPAIAAAFAGGLAVLHVPSLPVHEVVLLPPLLWAAVALGPRGATVALVLGVVALVLFGPSRGVLAAGGAEGTLGLQIFIGVGAASILAVAAVGEERRVAERRRALLERAMDQSPDPAGVLDEAGRFVWANEAAARQFAVPRSAIVGRYVQELAGGDAEGWRERWERVSAAGSIVVEDLAPGPDGVPVPFEVASAVVDVGGQRLMVSVLRDLSDRRRAEQASRLAALGTLAAGVAHEINNPLAYVVSNLAHLREQLAAWPDPDGTHRVDVLEPLLEAEEGTRRVRDIVRQLRAFARSDEVSGPVDPAGALRAALAIAHNELRHRARVTTDLAPTPAVVANENRLTQVFVNLLVNAAQAIPEGSGADRNEVRVTLLSRGDEVIIEVADTGAGMSAETRARIFEPFYTTKEPGAGTGLGLAISHSIVTALGGRIEVESAPGAGSRFRVILPAARAEAAPPPPPDPRTASRR